MRKPSAKLGELWDELNSKFVTLASLWGKEFKTSAGVKLTEWLELWLVQKGDGWAFIVIDEDNSESNLVSRSGSTRLDAFRVLDELRAQLVLVSEETRKEIQNGIKGIQKKIIDSSMVLQERGELLE